MPRLLRTKQPAVTIKTDREGNANNWPRVLNADREGMLTAKRW